MLNPYKDIYCGFFNSEIAMKNIPKSKERIVLDYELEFFSDNSGVCHIDGKAHPIKRGMLLCAKPGQRRYSELPMQCNYIRIFGGDEKSNSLLATLSTLQSCIYSDSEEEINELERLFFELRSSLISYSGAPYEQVKINSLFYEILLFYTSEAKGNSKEAERLVKNKLVSSAYKFIEENFTEDCSLSRIAEAVHVSPNHLQVIFSREMGMSPHEYVTDKRINLAKKLIRAGEKTILEIAYEAGFCSQSHFSKVFREKTGETPASYKRKMFAGF